MPISMPSQETRIAFAILDVRIETRWRPSHDRERYLHGCPNQARPQVEPRKAEIDCSKQVGVVGRVAVLLDEALEAEAERRIVEGVRHGIEHETAPLVGRRGRGFGGSPARSRTGTAKMSPPKRPFQPNRETKYTLKTVAITSCPPRDCVRMIA